MRVDASNEEEEEEEEEEVEEGELYHDIFHQFLY